MKTNKNPVKDNTNKQTIMVKKGSKCVKKIIAEDTDDTLTINNFNMKNLYVHNYNFLTENSKNIKYELLKCAEKSIDRKSAVDELLKFVKYVNIAHQLEQGIFEFSLINVTIEKLDNFIVTNIYSHKLYDVCCNLDENNKHVNNTTLLKSLYEGKFNPFFVAFMAPEQLHPQNWSDIVKKLNLRDETLNNIKTTNIYLCSKCGARKSKVSQIQIRSADEPMTLFITCVPCGNTVME
jgi:DNA-directed RNA polymerase subunit M/transcription elongation factor TFIIS